MENNRPTILLISSNSSGRGGGERYLVYLSMGLIKLGCRVEALLSTRTFMDSWAAELEAVGVHVHREELVPLCERPLRFIQALLDKRQQDLIAALCVDIRPDAILVNRQYDEDGLDYLLGAQKANVCPVSGIIHMPMTKTKNKRPFGMLRGSLLRFWYRWNSPHFIFSSLGSETEFTDYYRINIDSTIVHSGSSLRVGNKAAKISADPAYQRWLGIIKGEKTIPIIGFVGQFVDQKNIDTIIDGWIASGMQSRLLLIGDGPDRDDIEARLYKEVDKSLWYITGWSENYADYMADLDLFVMPSHYEGLPLALIEAVGEGIPAIISDFNGAEEIASHASWVEIMEENNSDVLSRHIRHKIDNIASQQEMGAVGRDTFVNYFSCERMARDMLKAMKVAQ